MSNSARTISISNGLKRFVRLPSDLRWTSSDSTVLLHDANGCTGVARAITASIQWMIHRIQSIDRCEWGPKLVETKWKNDLDNEVWIEIQMENSYYSTIRTSTSMQYWCVARTKVNRAVPTEMLSYCLNHVQPRSFSTFRSLTLFWLLKSYKSFCTCIDRPTSISNLLFKRWHFTNRKWLLINSTSAQSNLTTILLLLRDWLLWTRYSRSDRNTLEMNVSQT